MTESREPRRSVRPADVEPQPTPEWIDPYAHVREGREPTPEEIDAFVHAHDRPHPSTLIDPMHGPYHLIPRDEDGRIHPWYFCDRDEIEALQRLGVREPPRRLRKDGWTPKQMTDFIDALSTTASVAGACAYVGKSRMSAYRLRNRADAGHFRRAWDEALRAATAVLADTAYQRAVEGVRKTIWYRGERVGEETVYNDRLLMFLLRVRDPLGYAPIDELDRAQRLRPLANRDGIEGTLDRIEADEETWRHSRDALPPGDSPAIAMLTAPVELPPLPFTGGVGGGPELTGSAPVVQAHPQPLPQAGGERRHPSARIAAPKPVAGPREKPPHV